MHPIITLDEPLVVVVAPSGAGKNTLLRKLLEEYPYLFEFCISATNRQPRGEEKHGKEYYFISTQEFLDTKETQLLEWEEVYEGKYYGTRLSEIKRIHELGKIPLLDIDVRGAERLKRRYGDMIVGFFIAPPSMEELRNRITLRGGLKKEDIEERLKLAPEEMLHADKFDGKIVNDNLDIAYNELQNLIIYHPIIHPYVMQIEAKLIEQKESKELT